MLFLGLGYGLSLSLLLFCELAFGLALLFFSLFLLLDTLGLPLLLGLLNAFFESLSLGLLTLLLLQELLPGLLAGLLDCQVAGQAQNLGTLGHHGFHDGATWGLTGWGLSVFLVLGSFLLFLELFLALALLVIAHLLLLPIELRLLLIDLFVLLSGQLLLSLEVLLGAQSCLLGPLSGLLLALLSHLGLVLGKLLGALALDLGDAGLPLSLSCFFSFLFSQLGGQLTVLFLLLRLFFLLFKDLLELLDSASVLISQLLKLRAMLLLLFLLLCPLIFLFLAQELLEKFVSLLACLIESLLAIFDDLSGLGRVELLADSQSVVALLVSLKDVDFGIFDDILEHGSILAVLGCQVNDIVVGDGFAHLMVRIGAEKQPHALKVHMG